MSTLIVGEGTLDLNKLVKEIGKAPGFVDLVRVWKMFGQHLEVNDVKLLDIERRLKLGETQLESIPGEIIKLWKAIKGTDATLEILCNGLIACVVPSIAESLLTQFGLGESKQAYKFIWRERLITLNELIGENISHESNFQQTFCDNPIQLLNDKVVPPELPKCYIPRTLRYNPSKALDTELFVSNSSKDHVFLFKGISKPDLAKLTGYKAIEMSGTQLCNVTVRFILVECDWHIDQIFKSTLKPVHVIQHKGGQYLWIWSSSSGLHIIREFLSQKNKNIDEKDLVTSLVSQTSPCNVIISTENYSPRMGKTALLASLAKQTQERSPLNSIHLFIRLQEFVQQMKLTNESRSSAIEAIAAFSSCDNVSKLILQEILKSESTHKYLYLDDYGKTMILDYLGLFEEFLNQAYQELDNIKVIVTTTPNLKTRLETFLQQFSFEILPFNMRNQIDFLISNWVYQHGSDKYDKYVLEHFSKQCLEALNTNLTDMERKIAGIPLQCMMLAEFFAEDAKRASYLKTLPPNTVKTISLFQLYKKVMELRFHRIVEPTCRIKYVKAHVSEAVRMLFPDWIEIFELNLGHDRDSITTATLYSVGLLEEGPNAPRFVHSTFADYLVAEFLIENMKKDERLVDFLIEELLGRKGMINKIEHQETSDRNYDMKHPKLVYFVEMQMKEIAIKKHNLKYFLPSKFSTEKSFDNDNVRVATRVCSVKNFVSTSDFVACAVARLHRDKFRAKLAGVAVFLIVPLFVIVILTFFLIKYAN